MGKEVNTSGRCEGEELKYGGHGTSAEKIACFSGKHILMKRYPHP